MKNLVSLPSHSLLALCCKWGRVVSTGTTSGPFQLTSAFAQSMEFIRSDEYLAFSKVVPDFEYKKRDFLFRSGVWRGSRQKSIFEDDRSTRKKTLLLGHSDLHTGLQAQILLRLLGVKHIWGTNLTPVNGFSNQLPLGLTNKEPNSRNHELLADDSLILEAVKTQEPCKEFRPELYINLTPANNLRARLPLTKIAASGVLDISHSDPSFTKLGRLGFLRSMRSSPLTPCPEGNGVDTHRLWECLYVGGTPVVISNPIMNKLYDLLPVIKLNSWSELLDLDAMSAHWETNQFKAWDSEILSLTYWKNAMTFEKI